MQEEKNAMHNDRWVFISHRLDYPQQQFEPKLDYHIDQVTEANMKTYRRNSLKWLRCQLSQPMLVPLMTNQLVPPVESLFAIPITARMEAMEGAHDREVLLEMASEVGVPPESLAAAVVGAEEQTRRRRRRRPA